MAPRRPLADRAGLAYDAPVHMPKPDDAVIARKPEIVQLGDAVREDDLLFHDEHDESMAFLLSRLSEPDFPEPMGVFYQIEDDCYEDLLSQQVADAKKSRGPATLDTLFNTGDTYVVEN